MPWRQQIKRAIEERLAIDPVKLGKPLRYSLCGLRRLRVGDCLRRVHTTGMYPETNTLPKQPTQGLVDWRIIYRINGNVVEIIKIGNRKDVYES
jgi:mRNA-degrading endonuclease RelE of RelBE toxin-antitoxin system